MYYYMSLPNNLRMNILYGKVIAIAKLILFAWEMCNKTRNLTKIGDPCPFDTYLIF